MAMEVILEMLVVTMVAEVAVVAGMEAAIAKDAMRKKEKDLLLGNKKNYVLYAAIVHPVTTTMP
jgi:hypothetical protein